MWKTCFQNHRSSNGEARIDATSHPWIIFFLSERPRSKPTGIKSTRCCCTQRSTRWYVFTSRISFLFTVHWEKSEEMARYAEDVYYEFAIKLTHDAAQVRTHVHILLLRNKVYTTIFCLVDNVCWFNILNWIYIIL